MKIFNDLAENNNKCVIIVTHSNNVYGLSDEVIDLMKLSKN